MTDRGASRRPLAEAVAEAVAGGVDRVQIRERGLDGAALLDHCRAIARAARVAAAGRRVQIVVNRRLDVALAIGADGVHLGFDALPVDAARRAWHRATDRPLHVGVSAHSPEEVRAAAAAGADAVHLAPIHSPLSKPPGRPPLGLEGLRAAAGAGVELLAQGGVEVERVAALLAAGASGVAVTGALLAAPDPRAAARRLRAALDAEGPDEGAAGDAQG